MIHWCILKSREDASLILLQAKSNRYFVAYIIVMVTISFAFTLSIVDLAVLYIIQTHFNQYYITCFKMSAVYTSSGEWTEVPCDC